MQFALYAERPPSISAWAVGSPASSWAGVGDGLGGAGFPEGACVEGLEGVEALDALALLPVD
jgi:hypothetical protein